MPDSASSNEEERLILDSVEHLEGDPLTVAIWSAHKSTEPVSQKGRVL